MQTRGLAGIAVDDELAAPSLFRVKNRDRERKKGGKSNVSFPGTIKFNKAKKKTTY